MPSSITQKFTERMRVFDEEFGEDTDQIVSAHNGIIQGQIKQFIRDTVIAVLQAEMERLETTRPPEDPTGTDYGEGHYQGVNDGFDRIIESLDLAIKEIKEI